MSHVYPNEFTNFMEWLEGIYEELRITRGKLNRYLGMKLGFQTPGDLWVTMVEYLNGILEYFPEVMTGISMSP